MERTWLAAGREYTSGKDRDRVAAAIDAVVWHAPSDQGSLSPVLMLQEVVRELRLPKVSALAWGGGEANMLEYPDGPETATYTVLLPGGARHQSQELGDWRATGSYRRV